MERHGDRITMVLTTPSIHRPGVRLERRLTLSSLPLVEMLDTLINGGAKELKGRIQTRAGCRVTGGALVAMTRRGLVRGLHHVAGRSFHEHDLSEEGADWPEGWVAFEDQEGAVAGLLWDTAARVQWRSDWLAFDRTMPELAPGASAAPAGHVPVRGGRQRPHRAALVADALWPAGDSRAAPAHGAEPLEFGLQPRPLVVQGEAEGKLIVDSVGRLALAGTLTVSAPSELEVSPSAVEFEGVCEASPRSEPVTVRARRARPRADISSRARCSSIASPIGSASPFSC